MSTTTHVNRLWMGCVVLGVAAGATMARSGVTISDFEIDSENWTIMGDAQGASVQPNHSPTGGNPDGHIWAVDDAVGGVWYFRAPTKFIGDKSLCYGGTLEFDLKQTYPAGTTPFDVWQGILRPDVALTGPGGLVVAFNFFDHPPLNAWKSYSVQLHESVGWRNQATGQPATTAEMLSALTNLERLEIRGEYRVGPDTGFLDNVVMTCAACTGDLNADGVVDAADLGILLGNWGGQGVGDLTGDGIVDAADLGLLLGAWGSCR